VRDMPIKTIYSAICKDLVVDYIGQCKPASLALCLGHNIGIQHIDNVPRAIDKDKVFVAERTLDLKNWINLEKDFSDFFKSLE